MSRGAFVGGLDAANAAWLARRRVPAVAAADAWLERHQVADVVCQAFYMVGARVMAARGALALLEPELTEIDAKIARWRQRGADGGRRLDAGALDAAGALEVARAALLRQVEMRRRRRGLDASKASGDVMRAQLAFAARHKPKALSYTAVAALRVVYGFSERALATEAKQLRAFAALERRRGAVKVSPKR